PQPSPRRRPPSPRASGADGVRAALALARASAAGARSPARLGPPSPTRTVRRVPRRDATPLGCNAACERATPFAGRVVLGREGTVSKSAARPGRVRPFLVEKAAEHRVGGGLRLRVGQ